MSIRVDLGDLADELKDYSGLVFALMTATDLDSDTSNFYSSTAYIIFHGLRDIVDKMKLLADNAEPGKREPYKEYLKTTRSGVSQWHLATNNQIDQIRALLNHDEFSGATADDGAEDDVADDEDDAENDDPEDLESDSED